MAISMNAIRNVAVCGHGSTGKTSLVEQMLFRSGVISKAETIESGRTQSDYLDDEIEHQFSLHTSLMNLPWKDMKINVLDTPGSADFVGEVVASFRAAETAIMVISAPAGIQIETVKLWRRLDNRDLPRIVFVNKMDMDRADFRKSLSEITDAFGVTAVPLNLPLGESEEHTGIVDLLHMKAILAGGQETDIPAEMNDEIADWREKLIEMAAEGDDELTEKFFDQGTLEGPDILKGLLEGMAANTFVPVLCGSAEKGTGINDLLDIITELSPAPGRDPEPVEDGDSVDYDASGEFSGFVYKTSIDKFSGKISYIKVVTGVLKAGEIYNARVEKKERVSKVFHINGKNIKETTELVAGDLGAVVKLESVHTNDSISSSPPGIIYKPLALPAPVHTLAISAENQKDEDKMNDYLHKVAEQDLTFKIGFDEETKETVISGMGEMHIISIFEKLLKESKIKVLTRKPRVPYRETITKTADAEYTHKKQSGGHGQYGRVLIKAKPLSRGDDFELTNDIKGGSVSKGYFPGIEKGLREAMGEGVLAGYPMVDIGVSVYDGKEHPVDSSEMAFKLAAKNALKLAMEKAGPTLLEPMVNLTIYVEDQYLGDVLSDLSTKRGRVQDQVPIGGGIQSIKAVVPQGELLNYAIDMKSLTSGTGAYEMEFSHYDPVSGKVAQDIVAASKKEE
ncbi:MAG: elongation factor G [Spirochaetaceae bacterium]|nr:elongation factor G [Spirochaetaceae bacterium]MDT8297222.1 elongation factor G [Spirochaetaceae bacterium]